MDIPFECSTLVAGTGGRPFHHHNHWLPVVHAGNAWRPALGGKCRVLVSFREQKIRELPRVGRIELGLVVAAEEIGVVLQWIPVRGHGDELTQVGLPTICQPQFVKFLSHLYDRLTMNPARIVADTLT
jgi:hypothetical protein